MSVPIPDSYWVEPGRLLAGEYPAGTTDAETALRLQAFLAAGVTSFLDLTQANETSPYQGLLGSGIRYLRMPIPDLGCPSEEHMLAILDRIDQELADGHVVYVHCWGGVGRTGTVVGCWLSRRGLTGEQALDRIPVLRTGVPNADWHHSPQTKQQREFVRAWPPSETLLRNRKVTRISG